MFGKSVGAMKTFALIYSSSRFIRFFRHCRDVGWRDKLQKAKKKKNHRSILPHGLSEYSCCNLYKNVLLMKYIVLTETLYGNIHLLKAAYFVNMVHEPFL